MSTTLRRCLSTFALVLLFPLPPSVAAGDHELDCDAQVVVHDDVPSRRMSAALRLASAGVEGRDALVGGLFHPRDDVRLICVRAFERVGGGDLGWALAGALYDPNPQVAGLAATTLRDLGPAYLPDLRAALSSWSGVRPAVARRLIEALAVLGDRSDRARVRPFLDAPAADVAIAAVRFLGIHGDREDDVEVLLGWLNDPRPEVAQSALASVDALLERPHFDALLELLDDPRPGIQDYALVALRQFGRADAFDRALAVRRYYRLRSRLEQLFAVEDPTIQLDALRTAHAFLQNDFGFYEDVSLLPRLASLASTAADPTVRRGMLQMLYNGSERSIAVLPAKYTEWMPAESRRLVHLPIDGLVVPALIAALADPEPSLRAFADEALQSLSGREFGFPFDGIGTPQQRRTATERWSQWWRQLRDKSVEDRTQQAVAEALESLAEGGEVDAHLPGLTYVTGWLPPSSAVTSGPELVGAFRRWRTQVAADSPLEWVLSSIAGRAFTAVPMRTWHRLARLADRNLDLRLLVLPEERARFFDELRGTDVASVPPARELRRWLFEDVVLKGAESPSVLATRIAFVNSWYDTAAAGLDALTSTVPDEPVHHLYRGATYLLHPQPELMTAEASLRRALELEPEPAAARVARYFLGRVAAAQGRPAEAVSLLQEARLDQPGPREIDVIAGTRDLVASHLALGRPDLARRVVDGSRQRDQEHPAVLIGQALLQEYDGAVPDAIETVRALLRKAPMDLEAHRLAVRLLDRLGQRHEADREAEVVWLLEQLYGKVLSKPVYDRMVPGLRAVAIALQRHLGETPELYRWLGRIEVAGRGFAAAQSDLECYLEAGGDDPFAVFALGMALEGRGRNADALRTFMAATRANPALDGAYASVRKRLVSRLLSIEPK